MDGGCVNVLQVLLMEIECDVAIATKVNILLSISACTVQNMFTVRTNCIPFCCQKRLFIMPQAIVCSC